MQKVVLLVLLLVTSRSSAQQMKCVSESKYFIPNFDANWFKATEYCNYLGMRLAIISTPDEQAKVVTFAKSFAKFTESGTEFWIGGSDLAEEGNFYWHTTGVGLTYTNWHENQPDNTWNIEDCMEIRYIPPGWIWHWNDRDCNVKHYFICENTEHGRGILIL